MLYFILGLCVFFIGVLCYFTYKTAGDDQKTREEFYKKPDTIRKDDNGLPPPGTTNRFQGFDFRRTGKHGNFYSYNWIKRS